MKIARRERRSPQAPANDRADRGVGGRLASVTQVALGGATRFLSFAGGTARATGSGAADTTSALQALPDSTLRGLAATSVGLGTGFFLAGKSRLVVVAGIAPALLAAAAIIVRPSAPRALVIAIPASPRHRWRIHLNHRRSE
jgi:hypothetical protein